MPLNILKLRKTDNPVSTLDSLSDDTHAILAVPDNSIYNPHTTRGLLLTAYRKKIPIFGYSRSFVNNGALAGLYSSRTLSAKDIAKWCSEILDKNDIVLPLPKFANSFKVTVNYQVARALGINIDSEQKINDKLLSLESIKNKRT